MGAFAGAVIGSAFFHTFSALGAGIDRRGARHPRRCRGAAALCLPPTAERTGRARSSRTSSPSAAGSWSRSSSASSEPRSMAEKFDAIIVGAGQAGPPLAGRLTDAGQTVAVIERKLVGGTCVNTAASPPRPWWPAHMPHTSPAAAPNTASAQATSPSTWRRSRRARTRSCVDDRSGLESWLEGMNGLHVHPRPRPLRGSAHHPRRRPACWRPTGSSSTSAAVRWRRTCRDSPTSTT